MSSPLSAAQALRESFGDRRPTGISRRITACVSCRKLKIKCRMNGDSPPCTRCQARGLSCTVNKSLQAILESDASWKEKTEQRLRRLETALDPSVSQQASSGTVAPSPARTIGHRLESLSTAEHLTNDETRSLNVTGSLGAFPGSSLSDCTLANDDAGSTCLPDLISCRIVTVDAANTYFNFYREHLNPLIHHLLHDSTTLADVRGRSAMLTAAICTVAALCMGSRDHQACLKAYQNEVSRKLFSTSHSFDDVRALCIGAFWQSDMPSVLNGLAVRVGTQLQLHRCITKMPHAKQECYNRTRLFFIVYLCDHNCSLLYGRPPMTTEFRSLKRPGVFLQSQFSAKDDLKLLGQVEFWSLNRQILDLFGSDVQSAVEEERLNELRRMDDLIDRWYQDWQIVLDSAGDEGNTSKCFLAFYTHSAKLYLYSHAFRGQADTELRAERTVLDVEQIAGDNALAILRSTMDIAENIRLETLPSYFGTMIAYASVCIIRTVLDGASRPRSEANKALRLMREMSQTILDSSIQDRSHTLLSIATSLRRAIKQQDQAIQIATNPPNYDAGPDLSFDFDFDLFVSEQNGITFPGYKDFWLPCPDEMPEMAL